MNSIWYIYSIDHLFREFLQYLYNLPYINIFFAVIFFIQYTCTCTSVGIHNYIFYMLHMFMYSYKYLYV